MKKLATWQLIKNSLERYIPAMLLYVVRSSGSSPGRQGFSMAATADGRMEGSIGGGMMEHKLVERAKRELQTSFGKPAKGILIEQIHRKSATKNQSGMICSGEQTVFLYPVQQKDRDIILQIFTCLQQNENGTLVLSQDGIAFETGLPATDFSFVYTSPEKWIYKERLGYKNHLYIVGGGHCALAFSRLMRTLDFYIHLFDDREGLLTMEQNEAAHQKKVIANYSELSALVPSGKNNYVVVMTFGYRTDDVAVRALLQKEFNYFGLLGSRAKIEKMFAQYRQEGTDERLLQKIFAPVGLPLNSETPEEIAVSIAAQILLVKNAGKK